MFSVSLFGGAGSAAEFEILDRFSVDGYSVLRGSVDLPGGSFTVGVSTFVVKGGNVGIGTEGPGTKLEVNGTAAIGKTYHNILTIGPLGTSPDYFYIDTKIPFTDTPAPQIHITGYNYAYPNKAVKLTLNWYEYANSFSWAQYKSDLGYYNPSRIRLGTYDDGGTARVRIEIANDSTYWSSYFISATDANGVAASYNGWSYTLGEMPAGTGNMAIVPEYPGIVYSNAGNVGIGTAAPSVLYSPGLHIYGGNPGLKLEGSNTSAWEYLHFKHPNYERLAGMRTNGNFVISTGTSLDANNQFAIDYSGNVGIGTSNPVAILDVGGTTAIKIPLGTTAQRPASPANGMLRINTTTGRLEYYNGGWNSIGAVVATGGNTVADSGGYRIHTFTGSGTFTVTSGGSVEVLVIGGGGGGAGGSPSYDGNGGGGAGGFLETTIDVVAGSYSVTVGNGGTGGAASAASPGGDGGNSIFSTLTAVGGGGGGSDSNTNNGRAGGSGGGASCAGTSGGTGGSPTSGQGYAGGNAGAGGGPGGGAGGGGGASAAGGVGGQNMAGGAGGAGKASLISGSSVVYAGGGGGSSWTNGGGSGGTGGGGGGGSRTGAYAGTAGTANRGGGGGGGTSTFASGSGGSGIVIIRYPK